MQAAGHDLLAKIHFLIEHADLVVAEISDGRPNVYYEIGYARGHGKTPLLVVEEGTKDIPADIIGLERLQYQPLGSTAADKSFKIAFQTQVTSRLNAEDIALIRDMVEGPSPRPAFIVVSPKPFVHDSEPQGNIFRRRTYGDDLGIVGLLSVFGSMWGDHRGLELISARHAPPELTCSDVNLYLIGSPKSTPQTGGLLRAIQDGLSPTWSFEQDPGAPADDQDPAWLLMRDGQPLKGELHGHFTGPFGGPVWIEDWGLIVRGPHPQRHGRIVLMMAGAHSLGTGAACLAATRSAFVRQIRELIGPDTLADKTAKFWVLVKAVADNDDCLLSESGVVVCEAGKYT